MRDSFRRTIGIVKLAAVFTWHITLANFYVARIAFSVRAKVRPGIVAMPLRVKTDASITALTLMLTLTPGAVPVDISHDKEEIFILCLDLNDLDSVRHSKDVFEKLLLEVET